MAEHDHNAPLSPCTIWQGELAPNGYPRMYVNRRSVPAHRLAYCLHHGIPLESIKDRIVRHRCDNPPCINPEHLLIGTHADNMADMEARGRSATGEKNGLSKLTVETVRSIRSQYVSGSVEFGVKPLARRYGVSPSTIRCLIQRKTWKHI